VGLTATETEGFQQRLLWRPLACSLRQGIEDGLHVQGWCVSIWTKTPLAGGHGRHARQTRPRDQTIYNATDMNKSSLTEKRQDD
jgi:hypothetical protein